MEKKKTNIIKTIITTGLLLLLAVTSVILVLATIDTPIGIKVFNVTSGSMEPKIKLGTLVFVKSQEEYQVADIITFYPQALSRETVTHRVFSREESSDTGSLVYRTKGDANESEDITPISKELIIGKVAFKIPYIGHVLAFTKTQMGFILLIVIPATIIIYSELGSIKNEVSSYLKEKKEKKEQATKKTSVTKEKKPKKTKKEDNDKIEKEVQT